MSRSTYQKYQRQEKPQGNRTEKAATDIAGELGPPRNIFDSSEALPWDGLESFGHAEKTMGELSSRDTFGSH